MKFFAIITLISAVLLVINAPKGPIPPPKGQKTEWLSGRHVEFLASFDKRETAGVAWALITGMKSGITPKTKADLKKLNLGFVLSPSSLHFGVFLFCLMVLFKKIKRFKIVYKLIVFSALYFLPFYSIKRLMIFKLINLLKFRLKKEWNIEIIFLMVFLFSFLLGHYQASPLGFSMSFLYIGTFIALRDHSKPLVMLGLFSSHLLIHYFFNQELSVLTPIITLPFTTFVTVIMPFLFCYLFSFTITPNWIEVFVRAFIVCVHAAAKWMKGTMVNPSMFLLFAIWMLLLKREKRYFAIALLLHGNFANSPVCVFSGPYSQGQQRFAGK